MCRSNDVHSFYAQENRLLKIKAFYLRLRVKHDDSGKPIVATKNICSSIDSLPEPEVFLNLVRSKKKNPFKAQSHAFVTLHRIRSAEHLSSAEDRNTKEIVYGNRDVVRVTDGTQFEVYVKDNVILNGVFRRDDQIPEYWKLECKCVTEIESGYSEADICIERDGYMEDISQKVDLFVKRRKTCRRSLSTILEERETDEDDVCDCCCEEYLEDMNGGDVMASKEIDMDMDMENVSWTVDVGIWVMCLGVGFLVSKASAKSLRRIVF